MENREIARLLAETADLMEIAGEDGFRIRSYRNAAGVIEGYPESIAAMAGDPTRSVTDIAGIGKGLAAVIGELLARGSFERRDALLERYPPTALEMLRLPGIGPKTVRALWEHFRVSTMADLERLCLEHKLQALPRMGAKLEEKILRGISSYRQSAGRFLLNFATTTAETVMEFLRAQPGVESAATAGSLRRGRETVGDIDILLTGPGAPAALAAFAAHPRVHEVLGRGPTKTSVRFGLEGVQVDVRAVPAESLGAALQYFTGSKDHNVQLRTRAVRRGLTLNEYGLSGRAAATEEEIYAALGLAWIPPELRENQGEIEAAESGALPRLVEVGDMRGDLHMHTTESDGRAGLEEMTAAAAALGYEYIAITDHSKALAMANGLDEARAAACAARVREFNANGAPLRVFSGLECDILRDGRMDLATDALLELDYVVASVHSYMNLEPRAMTDRLLAAIECPAVRILGHPTGRVLLHRDAYAYEFETVAAAAAKRGVWMEINASPERLDLHAALIRAAQARGVRFAVATDAHHPRHLAHMGYGVRMARRGWLTPPDIMNTLPLAEFAAAIGRG